MNVNTNLADLALTIFKKINKEKKEQIASAPGVLNEQQAKRS